ncbi:hypothetical protein BpHYR1_006752 [Brachionus plicatilis]|uniref:Uncharacterized protein n=1 Tax=Brachionus plicatilis TaxID=10195 RepID=A0A3M7RLB0_BRAPC|nr:hypothetical protein BpHYR1_006752 [Brachionus plicatilis]
MIDSQLGQKRVSPLIIFSEVHAAQPIPLFENFFAKKDILCNERRKVDMKNRSHRLGHIGKPPDNLNFFLVIFFKKSKFRKKVNREFELQNLVAMKMNHELKN